MTKHFNYSIRFHWVTFLCFLLPFFYTGCDKTENGISEGIELVDKASKEKTERADSINELNKDHKIIRSDTLNGGSTSISSNTKKEKDPVSYSQMIVSKAPFLKPVLTPAQDISSGFATVIDAFMFFSYTGTLLCFLFMAVSLITKYMAVNAKKLIALLDLLALIFLLCTRSSSSENRLWGFWVAVIFLSALTIYDFIIIRIGKNEAQSS